MAKVMFPYKWTDGTWRDGPEPTWSDTFSRGAPQPDSSPEPCYTFVEPQPEPDEWRRQGFFKDDKPMPRHEVALKASNARLWLETLLFHGPVLARLVLKLAREEGFSECALRRAKKRHGIKSKRMGGKGTGRQNPWIWQMPVAK